MTNITAEAVERLAFGLGLTDPNDFLLVRHEKAHEIASTLRLLSTEREQLQSAIHDMAKNIWRGDWNRLEQETRDVVERVMNERVESEPRYDCTEKIEPIILNGDGQMLFGTPEWKAKQR
jgi:hypothetical protein